MSNQFVANVQNLTNSKDRQSLISQLRGIPNDCLVTVRGMYDPCVHTLTLLSVKTLSLKAYNVYKSNGGKQVYVSSKIYKELNLC